MFGVRIFLLAWLAACFLAGATPETAPKTTYQVLLVGDSWAEIMWRCKTMGKVFAAYGYPDIQEQGDQTALGGTTASFWSRQKNLDRITKELQKYPDIRHIQLIIGGNDLLAGKMGGGWHTGLSCKEEDRLLASIAKNVSATVQHCLSQRDDIHVVICGYDYVNFIDTTGCDEKGPAFLLWNNLGQPIPERFNRVLSKLEKVKKQLAKDNPRVFYINNLGAMQFFFGDLSKGIKPGLCLPPGNISFPSPPESLASKGKDPIHLNEQGYLLLGLNCFLGYYKNVFEQQCNEVKKW